MEMRADLGPRKLAVTIVPYRTAEHNQTRTGHSTVQRVKLVRTDMTYIGKITAIAATTLALCCGPSIAGSLRAGAARLDITPTAETLPAPVHDRIFVRALALDGDGGPVLLISIETPGLARTDELLESLADATAIARDRIFMTATHTHSAPFMALPTEDPYPYFDFLKTRTVDAARQAIARLEPAKIGFNTGSAYINVNRDAKVAGRYTQGFNPEGPSDKTVAVLTITDADDAPIAIYANYAVHGVVMFFSQTKDGQAEITGDIPGATSQYVEAELGDDVVALWTSGAAGDQNPVYTSVYLKPDGSFEDTGVGGWALLEAQARRLGEEIVRLVDETSVVTSEAELAVRSSALTCPPKAGAAADASDVAIPLTLLTIGDIALAGVGGELYSEIGTAIKDTSPFEQTMVVTLLPGEVGYIPSDRAYTLPAEMAVNAKIASGCAEQGIPEAFRDLVNARLSEHPIAQ